MDNKGIAHEMLHAIYMAKEGPVSSLVAILEHSLNKHFPTNRYQTPPEPEAPSCDNNPASKEKDHD